MRTVMRTARRILRAAVLTAWRMGWFSRRSAIVLVLFACYFFVVPIIAFPLQAPAGWRNVSIYGRTISMTYAVSTDEPGLMLSRGTVTSIFGDQFHIWRTRDGGQNWMPIPTPFSGRLLCFLAAPVGGHGTFFAAAPLRVPDPQWVPIWVTHDAGTTWHQVTSLPTLSNEHTIPGPFFEEAFPLLANAFYRDGRLYGLLPPANSDQNFPKTFSVSADDGKTWMPLETTPSALERQGGNVFAVVPDYSGAHVWFREITSGSGLPMLEHSADNGHTWQFVSQIGTAPEHGVTIGTSPTQPDRLCAATNTAGDAQVMLSSADGGQTWHSATVPPGTPAYSGYNAGPIQMAPSGTCYLAENVVYPQTSDVRNVLWQLSPGASVLRALPLPATYFLSSFAEHSAFAAVPAGHGIPARLTIAVDNDNSDLSTFITTMGGQSSQGILLWMPAP